MSPLIRMLKISVIGIVSLTGLVACHPTYVQESYYDSSYPAYSPVRTYSHAPSYSVQYYANAPTYVERTVVVPRVVVTQPRIAFPGNPPHHDRYEHNANHRAADRGDDRRDRHAQAAQINPVYAGSRQSHIARQSRNEVAQPGARPSTGRDQRREHGPDRTNLNGNATGQ
jgi:hypothetical protein